MNVRLGIKYTPQLEDIVPTNTINGIYSNFEYLPSGKMKVVDEKALIQFDYGRLLTYYRGLE